MHLRCLLLLLALGAAGFAGPGEDSVIRDEKLNFEIAMPPESIDWERKETPKGREHVKVIFYTDFKGMDPLPVAHVELIVWPLSKSGAKMKVPSLGKQWQDQMEGSVTNKRDIKEGERKLGGQPSYFRDVKGNYVSGMGHITWDMTRMGQYIYVLHVIRTYKAIGDEDLEAEIASIRNSFKFLKEIKVEADKKAPKKGEVPDAGGAGGEAEEKIDPELLKREELEYGHWRFKCAKPEGLLNIDPKDFTDSEKANNLVARFHRRKGQVYLMIRIFVQSSASQRYTLDQLAKSKLKYFEQTYKKHRLDPEEDYKYKKFPLAKEAVRMKLVGRRTVPETTIWLLGQCKNDRQYQIEIYATGSSGEKAWKAQLADFHKNFKPTKK